MNQKRIFCIILLFMIASLDICLIQNLEQNHGFGTGEAQLASQEESLAVLRALELPQDAYEQLAESGEGKELDETAAESLLASLFCKTYDKADLKQWKRREKPAAPKRYAVYAENVRRLFSDAVYFPVPESSDNEKAGVSYENSWQSERTYGGTRGHEGCDIMADIQQRGYYPVLSVSDGVVEKMGWLPQGGYRIGIRSKNGVYFYYAHLAEYEESMAEGLEVAAGQLIGYMGDTGYSEVEGTTGNFPVHLHFGMYLDDEDGNEVSFNPYFLLKILEGNRLVYAYQAEQG